MNIKKPIIFGVICCVGLTALILLFGLKSKFKPTISQTPAATLLSVGQKAPDFNLTDIDGKSFSLSEKRGNAVILFGMAGWCTTCIAEGKVLTKIKKDYTNKGVEVISVAFTKADTVEFLQQFKNVGQIDIPIALDTDNVAGKYSLRFLETTYIIDKKGIVTYKDEQNTDEETYKKELEKIL